MSAAVDLSKAAKRKGVVQEGLAVASNASINQSIKIYFLSNRNITASGVNVFASCSQKLLHYSNALLEALLGFLVFLLIPGGLYSLTLLYFDIVV